MISEVTYTAYLVTTRFFPLSATTSTMAGLRKILHTERTSFQPTHVEDDDTLSSGGFSPTRTLSLDCRSPNGTLPRLPHMDNQTFLGIERQFEEFHEQFQTRTSRSLSAKRYKYIEAKAPLLRTKRHVDVLQAIFSAHRSQEPTPLTPTSLYNEDIADRNMQARSSNPYTRIISAIYQEDVADRNIRVNGCNILNGAVSRYNMRLRKMRSRDGRPVPRSKSQVAGRSDLYAETNTQLRCISSDQDLRDGPSMGERKAHLTVDERSCTYLRPRSSAPSLSTKSEDSHDKSLPEPPRPCEELDVHAKSEIRTKSTATDEKSLPKKKKLQPANNPPGQSTNRLMAPKPARSSTRNIHNLSINTKLAAPRKNFVKVGPRPAELQVPTPKIAPSASLDEIVNSPVSVATSARGSPAPPSNYNVEEIMDLFKQAYQTTENINPHPTFESLQDAIVREINSHDAFRQIHSDNSTLNAPGLSPDLPSDEYVVKREDYAVMSRSSSRRSLSKHRYRHTKASPHSHRRNSDFQGRELSVAALKGMENEGIYAKRRRHTCAQPPSFELGQNYRSKQDEQQEELRGRSSRKRHSEVLYSGRSLSSRPLSSHSIFSKAVSAIFEPAPEPSTSTTGRSRPHISSRRSSSRVKMLAKPRPGDVAKESGISQQPAKPPPEIQVDHVSDNQGQVRSPRTFRVFPASTPVSPVTKQSPAPAPLNLQKNKTKRAVWTTSPIPSAGKKKIPFRSSSIKKDRSDSGRLGI